MNKHTHLIHFQAWNEVSFGIVRDQWEVCRMEIRVLQLAIEKWTRTQRLLFPHFEHQIVACESPGGGSPSNNRSWCFYEADATDQQSVDCWFSYAWGSTTSFNGSRTNFVSIWKILSSCHQWCIAGHHWDRVIVDSLGNDFEQELAQGELRSKSVRSLC